MALAVAAFFGLSGAAAADETCTQPQHAAVGAAIVQSTFDGAADGWTIVENDDKGGPDAEGGFITGTEGKGHATWFWLAPEGYLGNRSNAYGGSLSFDQIQSQDGSQTSDARHVYLKGGGLAIKISELGNPGTEWTHYVVLLHECADWKNAETGEPATAQEIRRVLGALEELYIRGEFRIGDDQSSLDNVVLRAGRPQAPGPAFAFSTAVTPDPGIGGERTTFELVVKNSSTSQNLSEVSVDIVFAPIGHDPQQPKPLGKFEVLNAICDKLSKDDENFPDAAQDDVAYAYRCTIGSLQTGASKKLTFVQESSVAGSTAYLFAASSKETGQNNIEPDDTGAVGENAGEGSIAVVPGIIELLVSIPPLGPQNRSGVRKEMVLTVTNKGNARLYHPVLDIIFSGGAVPETLGAFEVMAGRPEQPGHEESVEAPLEVCTVDGKTVHCVLVHESEFSEGEPYLAPGETRQISLAFTPSQAGALTLTGRAGGKDGSGTAVSAEFSQETTIIGPHFAMTLDKTTPEPYGTVDLPDGVEANLHLGKEITLHYAIYNGPDHGAARNVQFDVIAFDSVIKSVTIPSGANIACENKGDIATCTIDKIGSGDTVKIDVTLSSLERPVYVSAEIKGGGSTATNEYWIGADVDPFAVEIFQPGDRQQVFPGEKIVGGFGVGVSGDTIDGAVLRIMQPVLAGGPSRVRIGAITGCVRVSLGEAATQAECELGPISSDDDILEIEVKFNAVPEEELGQSISFGWELVIPDHYGVKADDDSSGTVAYQVVPKVADLAISKSAPDQHVQPGDTNELRLVIDNNGPATEPNVVVQLQFQFDTTHALISLPDATYIQGALAQVPDPDSNGKKSVKCDVVGNDVSCALGPLAVRESAEITISWGPGEISFGNYRYEVQVSEGIGEAADANSSNNNHLEGGGRIGGVAEINLGGAWVGKIKVTEEVEVRYGLLATFKRHEDGTVDGRFQWNDSTGGSAVEIVRGRIGDEPCFELRGTEFLVQRGRGANYELEAYTLCQTSSSELQIAWRPDRRMTLLHP